MVIKLCGGACVCWDKHDLRFAKHSTCHGCYKFCNTWHAARRVFWFLFVLASAGFLVIQLYDRFVTFVNLNVKTEVTTRNVAKYPLPAVTICNMNMFSRSLLNDMDTQLLNISDNFVRWILQNNQQKVFFQQSPFQNASSIYWEKVAEYEELEKSIFDSYNVTDFLVSEWLLQKGWQLNNSHPIIIECTVGKIPCRTEDFKATLTPQGLCYTINWRSLPEFWQKAPGSESGYSIIIDIDQPDYTAWRLNSGKQFECGTKVLLHEWYEETYTGINLASFVGIPPGVVSYMSVRPQEFTTAKALSCERDKLRPKRTCLADCSARDTINKCQCRLWFEPGTTPLCGVARTTACLIYKQTNLLDYDPNAEYRCHALCKSACFEKSYAISVSYTTLASLNTISQFTDYINKITNNSYYRYTSGYIKRNFISIKIGYSDITIDEIDSSLLMSPSAFISDLGGQLGFFAGISIVTIAELLEYPIVKIYSLIVMSRRRNSQSSSSIDDTDTSRRPKDIKNHDISKQTDEFDRKLGLFLKAKTTNTNDSSNSGEIVQYETQIPRHLTGSSDNSPPHYAKIFSISSSKSLTIDNEMHF